MLKFKKMEYLKEKKRQILVMLLLVLGLGVGIYLVQTKQIFKSRAADDAIVRSFSVTGEGGTVTPKGNGRSFDTDTLNVNISFGNPGPLPPQEVPDSGGTGGGTPTVDPCDPQNEANYDEYISCDDTACGYELWSCINDRGRIESFQHPDPESSCYQPENNSACPS